jgi:quinol monooxygenase YgiN
MATYLAQITVKPGLEADFEHIAAELYEATHGFEPAMRRYEYWRGAEERTYYCHATFDDFLGFLDHQTSEHHEALGPKIRETFESIRLEWVDPVATSSALAPTNMQPLPEEAAPLAVEYHERFAADVRPWWLPLR